MNIINKEQDDDSYLLDKDQNKMKLHTQKTIATITNHHRKDMTKGNKPT